MCAIAGIWSTKKINKKFADAFRDSMKHRGPDSSTSYFDQNMHIMLAHCRLSILDLTDTGIQPMVDKATGCVIVYNGEIYNFRSLREKAIEWGYNFYSSSDTEVLLAYYIKFGVDFVQYLRGMFAFAVYDPRDQTFLLCRDRVGIKPIYYYWDGYTFAFASEIKSFQEYPEFDLRLDITSVYDYMSYNYIPHPKSIYSKIRKLEPGTSLQFHTSTKNISLMKYWEISIHNIVNKQRNYILSDIEELIYESVKLHLVSDVQIGSFLSGGVDSSIIAAYVSDYYPTLKTFTIGFDVMDKDEIPFAQETAQNLKLCNFSKKNNYESFIQYIDKFLDIYDEPFGDTSGFAVYAASELARSKVKVILAGDGGDEVFGGYIRSSSDVHTRFREHALSPFIRFLLHNVKTRRGEAYLINLLSSKEKILNNSIWMRAKQKKVFFSTEILHNYFTHYNDYWFLEKYYPNSGDFIRDKIYMDFCTMLPERMLTKIDRASMSASVEVRVPFLDHKLIEYVFSLPSCIWFDNKKGGKWVLKDLLRKRLPDNLVSRPKKGFSIPLDEWFNQLSFDWVDVVKNSSFYHFGIFSKILFHKADYRANRTKWQLINLALWSDKYKWYL